jgi:hypothetical protein
MANTGYKFEAWSEVQVGGASSVTLTTAGTVTAETAAISGDVKAATEVSLELVYSDHALATAGLKVYIAFATANGYETVAGGAIGRELLYQRNASDPPSCQRIMVPPCSSFKLLFVWGNTTGGSNVVVNVDKKSADIPAAS